MYDTNIVYLPNIEQNELDDVVMKWKLISNIEIFQTSMICEC
jgi:hypothetical protein